MRAGKIPLLLLGLLLGAALAAGGCRPVRPAPLAAVTLSKTEDAAQLRWEGPDLVLDISSPSGIGGARVAWQGPFPGESLLLRLHLAGLEGLHVRNSTGEANLSVLSSLPYTGRAEGDAPGVAVQRQEGSFDVRLDQTWLQTGSLDVAWVDFYR